MPKFTVLSDIHLNLWKLGDPYLRLMESLNAIHEALSFSVENNVDAILFCGDLFHTPSSVDTTILHGLYDSLKPFKEFLQKKALYIPGNHDQNSRSRPCNSIAFLDCLGVVEPIFGVRYFPNMPPVYAIAYTENKNILNRYLDQIPEGCLAILHQGVQGIEVNNKGFTLNEILTPDMISNNIIHAFTGHYHTRKIINNNLTIPGALVQHNYGDAGEDRGFLYCTLDDESLIIKPIFSTNSSTFHRINYDNYKINVQELIHTRKEVLFISVENVPFTEVNSVNQFLYLKGVIGRVVPKDQTVIEASSSPELETISDWFDLYVEKKELEPELVEVGKSFLK